MVDLTDKGDEQRGIFEEITTTEGAIAYITDLVEQVEAARSNTVELERQASAMLMGMGPDDKMDRHFVEQLRRAQDKARDNLMIRYGRALGALATLMHVRRLPVEDYNRLAAQAHGALTPKTIHVVGG